MKTVNQKINGKLINFGFQTPTLKVEDHIFGAGFGGSIINPKGQWDDFKPLYEAQADNFETRGCTVWGTENALEFLHRFKFGIEKNYEELPPYIGAELHPDKGGNPNKVIQWIRDNGLVEAPAYSFPKNKNELLSLLEKPLYSDIAVLGKKWLQGYEVRHQWVLQGAKSKEQRIDAIKSALQYGVVGVSVTAWFQDAEGIYVDNGMRNTHWCVCYGWTDKGWKIFDSYDHSEKIYSYDSKISFAKLYFLDKKLTVAQKKSIWQLISAFLFGEPEELKKLEPVLNPDFMPTETKQEKLKRLCIENLDKDLSVLAPNELGCADALSTIMQGIHPDFPRLISTIAMNSHFDLDKRFRRTKLAKPWTVVIYPTRGKNIGHAWVLGENDIMYSNNSRTGKWDTYWTLERAMKHYGGKGLTINIFELV